MRALSADERPSEYHPRVPASYDDAILELYRAPHSAFVTERKRLAGELKAAGDKASAAKLAKLPRPPVSVWAVNQLWWQDRKEVEALLASAERLRSGDLGAAASHRETLGKLRVRAAAILTEAGHGATESTLRRVATTLSAIAAAGGFDPDPPGALPDDRDPPGFETMGFAAVAVAAAAPRHAAKAEEEEAEEEQEEQAEEEQAQGGSDEDEELIVEAEAAEAAVAEAAAAADEAADEAAPAHDIAAAAARRRQRQAADDGHRRTAEADARKRSTEEDARHRAALEAQQRAEAAAEQWKREEQTARRRAVRERVEAALRTAQGEVERQERDLEKLRASITAAEERLERARAIATDLEAKLAALD